ncbi:hypothetical protein BDZ91DRAFT_685650 [Kalaharituber pfeilii]|nr:hypothetical protein BDZ91DRAFT_685650 [Kalaharituber pfeilii]
MSRQVKSKEGEPIHEGDHVYTPFRGGRHEGDVEAIVTTQEEADREGIKNPPKVVFTSQNQKRVSHNPQTLSKVESHSEKE